MPAIRPKSFCCFVLALLSLLAANFVKAEEIKMEVETVETENVVVRFEKPLAGAAQELVRFYPAVKTELERALDRKVTFRPVVLLVKDGPSFAKITGNDMIVAFAVPHKSLIAIDYSRMGVKPFNLRETLKHELCHLLLHARIPSGLPKWFDEGLAQWVTDGLTNIMIDGREASLNEAVLFRRLLTLSSLTGTFPADRELLILAYEESNSMTQYIGRSYGRGKIYQVLDGMERGESFESAVQRVLTVSLAQLEQAWRRDLRNRSSWYLLFASNLYEIIFFFMALVTIYAFFAMIIRRWNRARREPELDDERV